MKTKTQGALRNPGFIVSKGVKAMNGAPYVVGLQPTCKLLMKPRVAINFLSLIDLTLGSYFAKASKDRWNVSRLQR